MTQTETTTDQAVLEVQTAPEVKHRPVLQMWFHEKDVALIQPINPFFLHLQRRLGGQIGTSLFRCSPEPTAPILIDKSDEYYCKKYNEEMEQYIQKKQEHQDQHQTALTVALARLERTVLFVPCISPTFLEALDRDLAASLELAQALENPQFQIMPILMRPTETGVGAQSRPLCTYAEGNERETALKELVGLMEVLLCNTLHIEPRQTALDLLFHSPKTVQPVIASQKTTMDFVLQALQPVQTLVEQATTQIVEARQLAISERSEQQTVQALAQEMEALRQQIQAQPSGWWSRFRKKQS